MSKNRDPDYVVKIEKAIAEKYGVATIQHPKKYWDKEKEKEYLEQTRLLSQKVHTNLEKSEKVEVDGFLISKKLLNKDSNRVCSICCTYSFNTKDDVYMNRYDCCFQCYIQWVEDREKRWESGWRPDKGENN